MLKTTTRAQLLLPDSSNFVHTWAEEGLGCRILGVPVSAPVSQIKQTYYKTIRDCHPDITGEADDEATEFCVFLNEIYEARSSCSCQTSSGRHRSADASWRRP